MPVAIRQRHTELLANTGGLLLPRRDQQTISNRKAARGKILSEFARKQSPIAFVKISLSCVRAGKIERYKVSYKILKKRKDKSLPGREKEGGEGEGRREGNCTGMRDKGK